MKTQLHDCDRGRPALPKLGAGFFCQNRQDRPSRNCGKVNPDHA
jgi:hypothetical protein